MKCGHADNAVLVQKDGSKIPFCAICNCGEIAKEITESTEGLKERTAVCLQHKSGGNKPVPSNWNLPFFQYKPNNQYDEYYCGCWGWD